MFDFEFIEDFEPLSELESEFLELIKTNQERISQHIQNAINSLYEATKIADQYGIPFASPISFLDNNYIPKTFITKFKSVRKEILYNLGDFVSDFESYGWHHSQIC